MSLRSESRLRIFLLGAVVGLLPGALFAAGPPSTADLEFFENKVRPVLAANCYQCHSLEQGKSKGGLTLDTRDGLLKGGEGGLVLTPGDPDKSMLVKAIEYADSDLQMPPKQKLADADIASLREWIMLGAPDPRTGGAKMTGLTDKARRHWAYQPVVAPAIPTVKLADWCQSPVDHFVLAKLEEKNMVPSPPANKDALIRRAYYDLAGLPPTPQEIEAFERDQSPEAFAHVVDRLLASPEYGERWGRHWLDTARYSDTIGGDRNVQPYGMEYRYAYAWSYRDYVINSFNEDKPYNRFILEQLAADKLPEAKEDPSILAGLGFLTVGTRFRNPNDVINERIDVVTKGFLASTVSCARCHDHRFDPIPTTDYYALHGIFASSVEPVEKPIVRAVDPALYDAFRQKMEQLELENREAYIELAKAANGEFTQKIAPYLRAAAVRRQKLSPAQVQEFQKSLDQSGLDRGVLAALENCLQRKAGNDPTFAPWRQLLGIPEEQFAAKAPQVINRLLSNADKNIIVNPVVAAALRATPIKTRDDVVEIYIKLFTEALGGTPGFMDLAFSTTSDVGTTSSSSSPAGLPGLAVMDGTGNTMEMSKTAMPVRPPAASINNPMAYAICQATQVSPAQLPFLGVPLPVELASQLTMDELRRVGQEIPNQLRQLENKMALKMDFSQVNELELTDPGSPERAMTMIDADKPHDSPVLIRGQDQVKGPVVPRHFLTILSPEAKPVPFHEGSGRLELAQAIASNDNPLTARVIVNRVWMYHFGEGIVPTPDDLGNQSEPPSHPELLDFLARDFMDNGWSLKRLHRLIMLSSVYQESSTQNKAYRSLDPENRLLSHANIRRLDFESLRDSLLIFSGKMDRTIGGQPVNLTDEPYSYRRSVYGYIDRGNLPELMAFFDFSDPDMTNSRRNSTIVPQQALFLMNSPMIVGVVRDIMARPELTEPTEEDGKINALYRIIFQRSPLPAEVQLARSYLASATPASSKAPPPTAPPVPSAPLKPPGKKGPANGYAPIHNEGELVARVPLSPMESFAQALLFANEMSYVY